MYDSRSDNVAARQGYKIPSLRTWNDDKWGTNEVRHPNRIKALTHDDVWARRANAEHGEGDRIELATPRSRQMTTRDATRQAIAEGIEEYLVEREEGIAGYRICFCGLHLERDDEWLLGFIPASTC